MPLKDEGKTLELRQVSKLHPALLKLNPGVTVEVQVWLNTATADVIAKLKKAGLTIVSHPSGGALVNGRIAASHLALLEAIEEVRYISPLIPPTPKRSGIPDTESALRTHK